MEYYSAIKKNTFESVLMRWASRESSLLFRLERGPGIALQAMQEKKALISRRQGGLGGFTELQRLCWFLRGYNGELREPLVWRQGS